MRSHLLPCPACRRHIRNDHAACPFCTSSLSVAFAATPVPWIPSARIGRAAIMGFRTIGATAIAASTLVGCGGDDDGGEDMGMITVDAAYGGPPQDATIPRDMFDPPSVDAAYGGPPVDASPEVDMSPPMADAAYGAPPADAEVSDATMSQLYGAVPVDASESR